jgi:hypothetical protein
VRALVALLLAGTALLPGVATAGPLYAEATLAEYFRLQWEAAPGASGASIAGYVENKSSLPFERMQLYVDRLDASGAVVATSRTWVMGTLAPNSRSYFTTNVPAAATYRVRVASFDWGRCRD